MPINVSVQIEGAGWEKSLPDVAPLVCQTVTRTLRAEGWSHKAVGVDVTLTTDAPVRRLNREWRGKDKPTNVLSFPLETPEMPVPRGRPRQLGDLVLAYQTLVREAREQDKPLAHHLTHLLVHGTLHLLGYDHETDADAERMERREVDLLALMGIPDPYCDPKESL